MSQPSPPAAEQEAADAPTAECLVHQLCTRCQSKLEVVEYDTEVKQAKAEAAVRDLEDRIAEATATAEKDSRSTSLREALEKGNNLSSVQRLSLLGSAFALVLPPEARAKDTSVPLCEPCAMDVVALWQRELALRRAELAEAELALAELEQELPKEDETGPDDEVEALEVEVASMEKELEELRETSKQLESRLEQEEAEARVQLRREAHLHKETNDYIVELVRHEETSGSVKAQVEYTSAEISRLKRTSVLAMAFRIWHSGPFGSINGFRMGRVHDYQIPWSEINVGWGQMALLLDVIVRRVGVPSAYRLLPRGSCSAILRKADNTMMDLYTSDGGFARFFTGRKFDAGMCAYVNVVQEVCTFSERFRSQPLRLPFSIEGDKVGGFSVALQFNQEERWTKAMKYLLTNLKWLMAYIESEPLPTSTDEDDMVASA
ncbi:beclin, putative [Perkinsus marinus ATCC 50983]|uniref:Beclin, putative n=1 Tax=Perkinsus marinus (strain ATCC 50983 / TXsc) TaxID=423536 RepID=C5KD08_PERM5|nr:beclin, putative [Perkinsus marinus ATCC 50983]EER17757.1 beclin, putative [Perkinsus marinus ATCC 50983]|eukprot:XP_002785961.1 beclin, putative [Perkinsus marinus ATCC 50983]